MTGASRGIGFGLSRFLATRGFAVFGCGRNPPRDAADLNFMRVDVRDASSVKQWTLQVESATSHLNVLINNAAILGVRRRFEDIDDRTWLDVINTNVLGTIAATRCLLPLLRRAPKPSLIINVGSILGRFGRAGWSTYAVTKFALEGLTQVLAQELASSGICVIALHPGRVSTHLRQLAYPGETGKSDQSIAEIGEAVLFFVREGQGLHSGQSFSVNDIAWLRNETG